MAIMDETDSGLDIDALRTVAEGINALKGPEMGIMLITHYQRMLNYITPDYVHVLYRGRIVRSGSRGAGQGARREGLRLDHEGNRRSRRRRLNRGSTRGENGVDQ